jgi:RNA polymerase sigma factor for flagellar operon FliA
MNNSTLSQESGCKEADLIQGNYVLVKKIAHHLLARLPNHVCLDDLVQAGMIGLIEAAKNYNPERGASFSTYAGIRIRGAIIDEMRRGDWAPRSVHRNTRRVAQVMQEVESSLGRDAPLSEVAIRLNLSIEQLNQMMLDTQNTKIIAIEDLGVTEEVLSESIFTKQKGPDLEIEDKQINEIIGSLMLLLPDRERLILSLYYDEELNLKEIGKILEISESRVSQLLTQAHTRLNELWDKNYN